MVSLAHHGDNTGGGEGLTGHVGIGIVGQNVVQDGIGDLVADFVGVASVTDSEVNRRFAIM